MDDYAGFTLFKDIDNKILQAYNRYIMTKNINEMHGSVLADRYAANFSEGELVKIITVAKYIDKYGEEEVKKMVGATV